MKKLYKIQEKNLKNIMNESPLKKVSVEKASEDLFDFAIDRSDIKLILQNLPGDMEINRVSMEYEIQLLKILAVGWSISLFFGTAGFADKLKSRFLKEVHPELPQQIMLFKKHEPEKLLRDLSDALGCDLELFRESLRIPEKDKVARDLMIYFLWQTGRFTNQKISGLFGLSYASVSRRVAIFREKLRVDKTFKKEYDRISALIKM